jgi:hypothetical protein
VVADHQGGGYQGLVNGGRELRLFVSVADDVRVKTIWLILRCRRPSFQSHLNQSTGQATNSRDHSPAMEPEHGVVKFGGRLAQTKRALTAIWLGNGRLRCAVPAFSDFCDSRSRTDLSVGEKCS